MDQTSDDARCRQQQQIGGGRSNNNNAVEWQRTSRLTPTHHSSESATEDTDSELSADELQPLNGPYTNGGRSAPATQDSVKEKMSERQQQPYLVDESEYQNASNYSYGQYAAYPPPQGNPPPSYTYRGPGSTSSAYGSLPKQRSKPKRQNSIGSASSPRPLAARAMPLQESTRPGERERHKESTASETENDEGYAGIADVRASPPAPAPAPIPPEYPPRGSSFYHPSLRAMSATQRPSEKANNGNHSVPVGGVAVLVRQDQDDPPTYEVIPYSQGKSVSSSGWNFLQPSERVPLPRPVPTASGSSHSTGGTLTTPLAAGAGHVLSAVPGDPGGRLVMTLMPGSGVNETGRSNHGTSLHQGTIGSVRNGGMLSLRPTWRLGNGHEGSKGCRQVTCSWRLLSIALLLMCGLLAAALAYLAVSTVGGIRSDPSCVLIEDAQMSTKEEMRNGLATAATSRLPSPFATHGQQQGALFPLTDATTPTSTTPIHQTLAIPEVILPVVPTNVELEADGSKIKVVIPANTLWSAPLRISRSTALKISLLIPRSAPFALYGRRNVAPTVTQHDFVEFLQDVANLDMQDRYKRHVFSPEQEQLDPVWANRTQRSVPTLNITVVRPVEAGRWFLGVYNDDMATHEVTLSLWSSDDGAVSCPDECNGRGECLAGKCSCREGYAGPDCSVSLCPVLCSGHGVYGKGVCHCDPGWGGAECDTPIGEGNTQPPPLESFPTVLPEKQAAGSESLASLNQGLCLRWMCSLHGIWDVASQKCQCERGWEGSTCNTASTKCEQDCGSRGNCRNGKCMCQDGWGGERCDAITCDARCNQHGQCWNGTCVCARGFNGKHCTLVGCPAGCSSQGVCVQGSDGLYTCQCAAGWAGPDCATPLETQCADDIDNDKDGLMDCADSDCCGSVSCSDHLMCLASADPADVLLRKQPPAVTAAFFHRVRFLVEDNAVQSYAHKDEYSESQFWNSFVPRRVSVLRGRVVTTQGLGIVGVRVSVERQPRLGFTLTRYGGWFDMLVNGGGAVTLQFQRSPFKPETRSVVTPWNRIMVLETTVLRHADDVARDHSPPRSNAYPSYLISSPVVMCPEHVLASALDPVVLTMHKHELMGGDSTRSKIYAEAQVLQESVSIPGSDLHLIYHSSSGPGYTSLLVFLLTPAVLPDSLTSIELRIIVEGSIFTRTFEADTNLSYTFAWDRHNVYRQKVYGMVEAIIHVSYSFADCSLPVRVIRTASVPGFDVDISDVGGWNLNIHHHYNFHEGIVQKGDGAKLHFRDYPRLPSPIVGQVGKPRPFPCLECGGVSTGNTALLLRPIALAAGGEGSLYIADFDLIRRWTPEGKVYTVLQLNGLEGGYSSSYHLAVSPADGSLYLSHSARRQIWRVSALGDEPGTGPMGLQGLDLTLNYEVVAGTGDACHPADANQCGEGGPALQAKLSYPQGIAVSADKVLYIADGPSIRIVDAQGAMKTLLGSPIGSVIDKMIPPPCQPVPKDEFQPVWPSALLLNPLDNSLHFLDQGVVYRLSPEGMVHRVVGSPLHCPATGVSPSVAANLKSTFTSLAFAPNGDLYAAQKSQNNPNIGHIYHVTTSGKFSLLQCANTSSGTKQWSVPIASPCSLGVVSLALTPDGTLYTADALNLQILALEYALPKADPSGEYRIHWPQSQEIYTFNRYGQHLATRDKETNNVLYSFQYSKNTVLGKLSVVTTGIGHKVSLLRDYNDQVTTLETSSGAKLHTVISRMHTLTNLNVSSALAMRFDYHPQSMLLTGKSLSDLSYVYHYDAYGRLSQVILPDGEYYRFALRVLSPRMMRVEIRRDQQAPVYVDLNDNDHSLTWQSATLKCNVNPFPNGTIIIDHPNYRYVRSVGASGIHQSWMWGNQSSFLRSQGSNLNGAPMIAMEKEQGAGVHLGASDCGNFYDTDRTLLLSVVCDPTDRPKEWRPPSGFHTLRLTLDNQGKVAARTWGSRQTLYSYDTRSNLAEIGYKDEASSKTLSYGQNQMPVRITLGSGRVYSYHYDDSDALRQVSLPSGSRHTFALHMSFSVIKYVHYPPGFISPFIQHYNAEGLLVLTVLPGDSGRIVYRYDDQNRVTEQVSGDRKVEYHYKDSGLDVVVSDKDYEIKVESKTQVVMQEQKWEYGSRTGLAGARFGYERDHLARITRIKSRVGGQAVPDYSLFYNGKTGLLEQIGPFKISRMRLNETSIFDGSATFVRSCNSYLDVDKVTLHFHNTEVFRLEYSYDQRGRINQTRSYTRYVGLKSYVNAKNYSYDADGQLVHVDAPESWRFNYDPHGNLAKLTYRGNSIPMQHNTLDRLIKFGEGLYQYDDAGQVIQNAREERFQWSGSGLLVRVTKRGLLDVRYTYDHQKRLVARKDHHGNVTQFFYADPDHPSRVTHIFNPRDLKVTWLMYDDLGHIMYAQILRQRYYVATDQCGTPLVLFNQYGELVQELVRSPYGHLVYNSNPYLYLPVDWCGGLADPATGLVHMPEGKVYDPLIGQWLAPTFSDVLNHAYEPEKLHLYRLHGNDPLNWKSFGHTPADMTNVQDWFSRFGYPPAAQPLPAPSLQIWPPLSPSAAAKFLPPLLSPVLGVLQNSLSLETPSWTNFLAGPVLASYPSVLGKGILLVRDRERARIETTSIANTIYRDVFVSILNASIWMNVSSPAHHLDTLHVFKEGLAKASDDLAQLNRLGSQVNVSVHDIDSDGESSKELKVSAGLGTVHVHYGTRATTELERLWRHSAKLAVRKFWHREQNLLKRGGITVNAWTNAETEQLLKDSHVTNYKAELAHSIAQYPELLDDPWNLRWKKTSDRREPQMRPYRHRATD